MEHTGDTLIIIIKLTVVHALMSTEKTKQTTNTRQISK